MMDFQAIYKHCYPEYKTTTRPDAYPDNWPRPLKCEVCGTKVARWGWRKHGNPRCGPHAGLVPVDELTYLHKPFFTRGLLW